MKTPAISDDLFDEDYLYFFAERLERDSEADAEQIWNLLELEPRMHIWIWAVVTGASPIDWHGVAAG